MLPGRAVNVDATLVCEEPKLGAPPARDGGAPERGPGGAGERQGDDERGHGRDRARRGDRLLRRGDGRDGRRAHKLPGDAGVDHLAAAGRAGSATASGPSTCCSERGPCSRRCARTRRSGSRSATSAGGPRRRSARRRDRDQAPGRGRDRRRARDADVRRDPRPLERPRARRSRDARRRARATASRSCAATTATSSRRRWPARSSAPSRLYLNTAFAAPQLAEVMERESTDGPDLRRGVRGAARCRGATTSCAASSPGATGEIGDPTARGADRGHRRRRPLPAAESGRYVILTSGTTGTPKGAQRGVARGPRRRSPPSSRRSPAAPARPS